MYLEIRPEQKSSIKEVREKFEFLNPIPLSLLAIYVLESSREFIINL